MARGVEGYMMEGSRSAIDHLVLSAGFDFLFFVNFSAVRFRTTLSIL